MRLALVALLVACGGKPDPVPPKRPNTELIVGEFERKPPDGTTAIRFSADGSLVLAKDHGKLDSTDRLARGTWKLDKDQLSLTYTEGMCRGEGTGVYTVVISRIGIRFTKVDDGCEQRSKIDGQIWRRR